MRVVLQRVTRAAVEVAGERVSGIGPGLLLLVGVEQGDGPDEVEAMASKVVGLRVFADEHGKMNRSLLDISGQALVVSQFTLLGDVARGRRPSFTAAAPPDLAEPQVAALAARLDDLGVATATGVFGAAMEVSLVNDGPVTLILEASQGRVR